MNVALTGGIRRQVYYLPAAGLINLIESFSAINISQRANGVSRLTGRNSEATNTIAPNDKAQTPLHFGVVLKTDLFSTASFLQLYSY